MKTGRRPFLALILGLAGMATMTRNAFGALIGGSGVAAYPLTALGPYLDTLIPRDDTGAATDFGVEEYFRHKARLDSNFMRLLQAGCRWLDIQALDHGAGDFAALDATARETVVERAASGRGGPNVQGFFDATRNEAMKAYYSDPRSWPGLGIVGPPQPEGYPDHADAPRA